MFYLKNALLLIGVPVFVSFLPVLINAQTVPSVVQNACQGNVTLAAPDVWACTPAVSDAESGAISSGAISTTYLNDRGQPTTLSGVSSTRTDSAGTIRTDAAGQRIADPSTVECQDGWLGTSIGFGCALAGFTVRVLAGITAMFTTLLQWSSAAFSFAIERTIVNFKPWFDTVSGPITDAWTLFRDLANIAIIGLFVFIAISIILGLQEYGQKKLIARVIIIATLINFSFLFTLIIVNTSNFFATTVYNAIPLEKKTDGTPFKIGEQFARNMKVYSYDDTRNLLMTQYNVQGFGAMFAYGAFAAIFALSATFVFLYGAFLIFARAVMLAIILLPLSAIAFASYLAPSFEEAGWKRWWHSLLQQSFMAPLLMIFIFISLNISQKVGQSSYDALANFATNPSSTPTWDVAFGFIVIVGSLFAGMYIASQLAGGAASRFAANGTMLPGAILARGIVAPVGRWTIGGRAAASGHALEQGMKNRAKKMATLDLDDPTQKKEYQKLRGEWASMSRQKGRRDFLAKSSFDLMNTKAMQKAGAAAGLGGALAGKSDKSYDKSSHGQVEAGLKEAMKAVITDQQGAELARKKHEDPTTGEVAIERQHKDNMEILKAAKETANAAKEGAGLTKKLADHQADISNATRDKADLATKFAKGEVTETEHRTAMTAINKRIEDAQKKATEVAALMRDIDAPVRDAQQKVSRSAKALNEFNRDMAKEGKKIQQRSVENAQSLAPGFAGGNVIRSLYAGTSYHPDSHVVHELREKIASKGNPKRLEWAQREKWRSEDKPKDDHAHSPAVPAGGDSGGEKKH